MFSSNSGPTAGVTGKGGTRREKLPAAESAVGGRFLESVGECPHLSGARGVGLLFDLPIIYTFRNLV